MIRYDENGVMIPYEIEGAKGGSSKPHTPVETPNNLLSVAYAKVLLAVAEGELAGTPTAKDIYLDGTPLQNEDGSMNFGGVKWEWRSGSQDQTAIEAFPEVSTEYNVGLELKDSVQWTRAITKSQLTDLRVTFQWPALMEQASNGDTNGYKMQYAIDISTNGGAFQEYQVYTIEGKTNTAYERTHKVKLPKPGSNWTIRARRVTPENNSSTVQDTINVKSYAEVVAVQQRYPNTALLYVEFDSRLFGAGSIPKISVKTKGRVIQVPSNYNPTTRVYSGIWDGSFKWAWTDNPAWVFYDLLTQDRFGLGHKVTPAMVDKLALYEIAQYCDVMVDDGTGSGTMEPRHTCNVFIQDKAGAWKVLRDIAGIFNGMTYWDGNKFVAVADKWEPITNAPLFSRSNVVNGMFDYQAADDKSIYTSALVSYDDPDNHYNTDVEPTFETSQIIRWGGDRQTEITAIGCTSRGEAQRKGKYTLITNLYNRTVSFQTGLQGLSADILPGKLIHVLDPLLGGRPYTGRIKASAGKVITLDRDVTAVAGDILYLTMGNGLSEGRTIVSATGNIVTVSIEYSKPIPSNSVWYLESSDLKSQLFRVTKVTNPSPNVYEIEGVEYNESKYDAIDNGARLESRPVSVVPPGVQKAPTNLVVSSSTYVEQTMAVTSLVASWDQMPNAVQYEVQWRFNDGDWVSAGLTGANTIVVKGIYTGNYVVRVRAINAVGIKSVWTSSVSTLLNGKTGLPPSVASLVTTGMLFGIRLDWTFPNGATDTLRTEIMYSQNASFASAIKLGDFSYPTDSHEMHGLKAGQQFWFWARLVDRSGNVGPWKPLSTESGIVGTSLINDDGQYNDYFAGLISNTALDKTLYDRIELIDGFGPGSVNERLNQSIESVRVEVDNVSDRVDTVNDRVDDALLEVEGVRDDLDGYKLTNDQTVQGIKDSVVAVDRKIDSVNTVLDDKITTVNDRVTQVDLILGDRIDETNATLASSVGDLQHQIDNIQDALEYDPTKTYVTGDIVRKGSNLYQAKTNIPLNSPPPNEALWRDIGSLLETNINLVIQVDKNTADIINLDGKVTSNVTKLEMMSAAWREDDGEGDLADAMRGWDNEANLAVEKITRANEDEALSKRVTLMNARVDKNEAQINTVEQAMATRDKAMAEVSQELKAGVIDANARITNLDKVVADNDKASASRMNTLESNMKGSNARIVTLEETVVTNNTATTRRMDQMESKVDNNSAKITELIETSTGEGSVIVERLNKVEADVGTNTTKITDLTTVVVNNESSTAERFTNTNSKVDKNTADITELSRTVVTADDALSERIDQMGVEVGKNAADITTINTTIANNESATAERIDRLKVDVDKNTAGITRVESAQAGLESTVATITNNLTAVFTAQRDDDGEGDLEAALKQHTTDATIASETKVRADADEALGQRVDVLTATVGDSQAQIRDFIQVQADKDSATSVRISQMQAGVIGASSSIDDLSKVVASEKLATTERFSSMQSKVDGNTAKIETLQTTTATDVSAIAKRVDNIQTDVNGNTSKITDLQTTFSDFEGTYAEDITLVNSRVDKEITDRQGAITGEKEAREASVSSEARTRAEADEALGRRVDSTDANVGENKAGIQRVEEAQAGLELAIATLTTNVSSIVSPRPEDGAGELDAALRDWTSEATFASEVKTRADADESQTTRVEQLDAKYGNEINNTNASIREEQLVRANADSALAQSVTWLRAETTRENTKLTASISEESIVRTTQTEALAQRITNLNATVDTNTANIKREEEARVEGDKVIALRIDEVAASAITGDEVQTKINASVRTEELARIDADGALGLRIDKVVADASTETTRVNALVQSETTARVNADEAIATRVSVLEAYGEGISETEVKALIKVETDARVSADTAMTSTLESQQLTINGHTSSISQQTSQIGDINGKITQSWTLKMERQSNGKYVAAGIGLGIENGPAGLQSQFLVRADRFAVVAGLNGTTTAPFVVSGGQVFINEALITKAMITRGIIGTTLESSARTNWASGSEPVMTMDFNVGNVITRHNTRAQTYAVMNASGMYVVVDGVLRVRMGTWD